jgi:P27 family predicted phage terminase small subunit
MTRGPKPEGGVGSGPPVSAEAPQPAEWLSDEGCKIFADLVARLNSAGGASQTHQESINLCAMALSEVSALSYVLNMEGSSYEARTPRGVIVIKARPEFAQRAEAARRVYQLLVELGLTPASRTRVKHGAKTGKGAGGDFDKL